MNLQVFENKTFGKVRVIERNNEPWFVGKDVAEVLGVQQSKQGCHCPRQRLSQEARNDSTFPKWECGY